MDVLSMHDSVMPRISHLKNIGSLSDADLANVEPFHYTASKKKKKNSHLLTQPLISSGKDVRGSRPLPGGLPDSNFCFKI